MDPSCWFSSEHPADTRRRRHGSRSFFRSKWSDAHRVYGGRRWRQPRTRSGIGIAYNPQNPDEAFIRSEKDMNLALYIPLIAGILILVLGVVSQITLSRAGL